MDVKQGRLDSGMRSGPGAFKYHDGTVYGVRMGRGPPWRPPTMLFVLDSPRVGWVLRDSPLTGRFEGSFGTYADTRRDPGYRKLSPLFTRIPTRSPEQVAGLVYTCVTRAHLGLPVWPLLGSLTPIHR
jgi:hypothetical protein